VAGAGKGLDLPPRCSSAGKAWTVSGGPTGGQSSSCVMSGQAVGSRPSHFWCQQLSPVPLVQPPACSQRGGAASPARPPGFVSQDWGAGRGDCQPGHLWLSEPAQPGLRPVGGLSGQLATLSALSMPGQLCPLAHLKSPRVESWGSLQSRRTAVTSAGPGVQGPCEGSQGLPAVSGLTGHRLERHPMGRGQGSVRGGRPDSCGWEVRGPLPLETPPKLWSHGETMQDWLDQSQGQDSQGAVWPWCTSRGRGPFGGRALPFPGPRLPGPCPRAGPTLHTACHFKPPAGLSPANRSLHILGVAGGVGWGAGTPWGRRYKTQGRWGPRQWGLVTCGPHGPASPVGAAAGLGALATAPSLCPGPLPGPEVAPRASPAARPGEPALASGVTTGPVADGGGSGSDPQHRRATPGGRWHSLQALAVKGSWQ
jgi:hypothetical protein